MSARLDSGFFVGIARHPPEKKEEKVLWGRRWKKKETHKMIPFLHICMYKLKLLYSSLSLTLAAPPRAAPRRSSGRTAGQRVPARPVPSAPVPGCPARRGLSRAADRSGLRHVKSEQSVHRSKVKRRLIQVGSLPPPFCYLATVTIMNYSMREAARR